jgi:hypothetical protein
MLGKSIIQMLPLAYPTKIKYFKKAFKPLNIIQKFQIRGKKIKNPEKRSSSEINRKVRK